MNEVVRLSLVHQSDDRTRAGKGASQHGLKQTVGADLNDDRVVRHVLQSFLEQHRAHQVVDEIVNRRVAS